MSNSNVAKKKKVASRKRSAAQGPLAAKDMIVNALRTEFPNDTIDVSDGYKGNIHLLVVSRKFDGMSERARLSFLDEILNDSTLTKAQLGKISLMMALSPADIK
jgi:hypothetical protein